jgi:uncharacterized protein (DUF2164 family)
VPDIKISNDERAWLVSRIQDHFTEELNQDIGNMDAERLIEMFAETVGSIYYNHGLRDAHALMSRKMDDLADELYTLEKTLPTRR